MEELSPVIAATLMKLDDVTLSEESQRKKENTICSQSVIYKVARSGISEVFNGTKTLVLYYKMKM